jgi:hypothetical protein
MANEIADFKITSLTALKGVARYNRWAPNKEQRVRYEFGVVVLNECGLSNECARCDYPMTADNVDVINNTTVHVECPKESLYIVPMVGFKPVQNFKIIK